MEKITDMRYATSVQITSIDVLNDHVAKYDGVVDANIVLAGISDLTCLPQGLKEVGGDLNLEGCIGLTSLGGLKEVGGNLKLGGCTAIQNLGQLKEVRGNLELQGCTELSSLDSLEIVDGTFKLDGCVGLRDLGRLVRVGADMSIKDCPAFESLGSLEKADGKIEVLGSSCQSLRSLGGLKRVRSNLILSGCTKLTSLPESLRQIGWCLYLEGCTSLTSLGGLQTVGVSVNLIGCTALTNLGQFERVGNDRVSHSDLYLRGCDALSRDLTEYAHLAQRVFRHADESRRPRSHCEDGPAQAIDGMLEYFWHGVKVPEYVIRSPEQITLADINGEDNAEVRRVKIFRYGLARYMQDTNAELINDDPRYGKLWRMMMLLPSRDANAGEQPIMMLEVVNSTAEPDGTFKTYWIPVRPTCTGNPALLEGSPMDTAYKAVWSTFPTIWGLGIPYDPQVET